MKITQACLVVVLLLGKTVVAQEAILEYGRIEELKGVTKFFVDAGEDLDLRNIIRDNLEKQLQVTVVDRPEEAQHIIFFRWADGGDAWRGTGVVAKRVSPDRLRILSNYRGKEAERDDLASDYAKWLIKQLRRLPAS
jgi:hypothetical protein